jgi:Ca2+-binding RTX toxin-like protein
VLDAGDILIGKGTWNYDLLIYLKSSGDLLTVIDNYRINNDIYGWGITGGIYLADGTLLSPSLQANIFAGSDSADTLDISNFISGSHSLLGLGGNDTMTGSGMDDSLYGGTGIDDMRGGNGNDFYDVDNLGDLVSESNRGGVDTVQSAVSYALPIYVENLILAGAALNGVGNSLDNKITGNQLDNVINGGTGADTLDGGLGNDTLIVDNALDVVVEKSGGGRDMVKSSVTYTLAANVEDLTLTGTSKINGTGNLSSNLLVGNSAVNTLSGGGGDDTLDGGGGGDKLIGGVGNDTYYLDSTSDAITELAGEGDDVAYSSVTRTLEANVEHLILTGSNALTGTGNSGDNLLCGNSATNTLNGSGGNDTLDGAAGNDSLIGGTGNDTYLFGRGYRVDLVSENDATVGNADVAKFAAGISTDQLWFRHVGNNLEASIIGTGDTLVLQNWYLGSVYHVEQFKTADGKTLIDTRLDNLVQAMAGFAPPVAGQTTLPANYQQTLSPVIAANWQ